MRATLLILLMPVFCFSQAVLLDSFTDGNFSQNPMWVGDTAKFLVNPSFELQLSDNAAGESYLSTSSGIIENASWEFYARMEFNPSSSNFCKVYLVSDRPDLGGNVKGYYVRLSGSSADRISLYRQDGSTSTLVAESGDDWVDLSLVEVSVKVTRDSTGFWVLSTDTSGGTSYVAIDSAADATYYSSQYFGFHCEYTSTRADKFFFDNVSLSGDVFIDDQAAIVTGLEMLDSAGLRLTFSELLDSTSAIDISNYKGSGSLGLPVQASVGSSNDEVELRFGNAFPVNQNLELYIDGVEDLFGNITRDTLSFLRFEAQEGQIIITELMPDPTPVVGIPPNALPEREYLEIYNNSGLAINLENWVLELGSTQEVLPAYVLDTGKYVVITKDEGVSEFPRGTPLLGIDMSSTALTNTGTTVALYSPEGFLVNAVGYSEDWYDDPNKENGGWSLEMVDITSLCVDKENWKASEDPLGGTPGKVNSLAGFYLDTIAPKLERIALRGDSSIAVIYSEAVDELAILNSNYSINPLLMIDSLFFENITNNTVRILFEEEIQEGVVYSLKINDLPSDCSGNFLVADSLFFGIPTKPSDGEVLINEILFNPYLEGSDFVELYNNSNSIFDLNKLYLGNWNAIGEIVENATPVLSESFLFMPHEYLALTTDPSSLEFYRLKNPSAIVKVDDLPSMSDKEGSLAVVTSDLSVVCDYFIYDESMHGPLLEDNEGVSLERVSQSSATQNSDNWQSAASVAGFATPGYENSMAYTPISKGTVTIDPKVFSPNQDGYHDVVNINYSFENMGNVVSVSVWNSGGQKLKELHNNVSVGQEGFFSWDGTDEDGQLLNSGIYIIVLEYFNTDGTTGIFKETCVLSL